MAMLGRTLGRYRIESTLGQGGMGIVYKARDTSLDRNVAIKVLPADAVADPSRKQRFVLEAKAASALNHPGIVTVHDVSTDEGVDFIVMELVAGRTLHELIGSKGLGVPRALRYGAAIADALAKAHEAGIVHRDLKPSNVMVTDDDRVKILDFGLAKLVEPEAAAGQGDTRTAQITEVGAMLGTPAYMSPEQVRGDRIDSRSDIFSFGAVLYQMTTGRRPFAAESHVSLLAKILDQDPPAPSSVVPIATDVERTILRCLRKDPARRFQTMADLKVAIEDLAADAANHIASAPAAQIPLSTPVRSHVSMAWSALAIVLAAVVAVVSWQMRHAPRIEPLRAVPLASLPGVTGSPSFSPDGNQIAFSWNGPDGSNTDIYVQQIGSGAPLRLTTSAASDYSPQWSPDGRWIAFLRGDGDGGRHELRLVPPLSGTERRLAEINPRGFRREVTLAWCPDSHCVVVTDSSGEHKSDTLFMVSLESGEKRQLMYPAETVYADTDPAISPDGKWLAFRRDVAPFSGELHLARLNSDMTVSGDTRRLTSVDLYASSPRWTPDSTGIVFSAKAALWKLDIRGEGAPERLPFVGEDGLMPIVSGRRPDGTVRLAYVRSYTDTNIWKVETSAPGVPASSPPSAAISSNRMDFAPDVSPDGRSLVFCSTRSGENEIWRADVSGSAAVQLTQMRLNPGWPRWSPDGELVVFQSNGVGYTGDIFVVSAEGGTPRNMTSHPAIDAIASFSRDGKSIYFMSTRDGRPNIWKMPVAGGPAIQITTTTGQMALESPDGAFLFYTDGVNTNAPSTLWRVPVTGGDPVRLVDGVISTSYDVAPGGVYYIERLPTETRLQYFDVSSNRSITVAGNLGDAAAFGVGVSPDGRTIFFSRVDSSVNDLMLVEGLR